MPWQLQMLQRSAACWQLPICRLRYGRCACSVRQRCTQQHITAATAPPSATDTQQQSGGRKAAASGPPSQPQQQKQMINLNSLPGCLRILLRGAPVLASNPAHPHCTMQCLPRLCCDPQLHHLHAVALSPRLSMHRRCTRRYKGLPAGRHAGAQLALWPMVACQRAVWF
jgi:hypothetical protein